jgi:hypothetical protein
MTRKLGQFTCENTRCFLRSFELSFPTVAGSNWTHLLPENRARFTLNWQTCARAAEKDNIHLLHTHYTREKQKHEMRFDRFDVPSRTQTAESSTPNTTPSKIPIFQRQFQFAAFEEYIPLCWKTVYYLMKSRRVVLDKFTGALEERVSCISTVED